MVDIKPVMDVSRPGKTPADPSSRPILVSNKSETTQDPILKHENKPPESPAETDNPAEGSPPLSNPALSAPDSVKKSIEDVPVAEQPATLADLAPAAKQPETEKAAGTEDDAEAESDDDANTKDESKDEAKAGAKKDPKSPPPAISEDLEKQIQAKTYFVPIGEKTARRLTQRRLIVFIVVLVVIVFAVMLMIDAGLIAPGVKLPFDLIKN